MFKPMLAKQYHKHRDKVKFPCMVQPKIDGLRLLWDGETCTSRTGKDSITVPPLVLKELQEHWADRPLDGELYCPDMTFEEISGALRRHEESDDLARIKYWVFDTPNESAFELREDTLRERVNWMSHSSTLRGDDLKDYPLVLVPTWFAESSEKIDVLQDYCLNKGFEGIMIRDPESMYEHKRTTALLKYKKIETIQGIVRGFKPGKGKHEGRLGALVLVLPGDVEVSVGTGFDDDTRQDIWDNQNTVRGRSVLIEYQEKTKYNVPRFPRFLKFADSYSDLNSGCDVAHDLTVEQNDES